MSGKLGTAAVKSEARSELAGIKSEEFDRRLSLALGGEKPTPFAKRIGLNPTTFRKYFHGTEPSLGIAAAIARGTGVELEWLATGQGPMRTGEGAKDVARPETGDLVPIQRVAASASAGSGLIPVDHEMGEVMGFSERWLRTLGLRPTATAAIVVEGDSMTREDGTGIPDGALALIDTSITPDDVLTGCIYVIVRADELLVKRIERQLDGTITLHSDNPRYRPEPVPADMMERLHIAGRVRWIGFRV
ncbi:LexA family transcriptional regulator [Aurantimonas sp. C2-6-R+9]|uniref:LexA family transcriptional regulator n=1 Tax=unclassified Aurantimonas TaxID=2638230 RepID=UPI002E17A41E|nr:MULTISPECIES: LexA family transcriptional regulator [unclassified Aurantimonas]MEC5293327.1 LexA family transcriptional regulator [Aurantimonas sp. C2-3-R2]MEC5383291.1 LexA family transcriptional regulator [Aurantimonas sp. C2-6-R+9]MEC5414258.1 LexA family transcriptional regulator [Aurantimonas sp. C2-4-R8]